MRLIPPAGAPEWLNRYNQDIEKTIRGPRDAPFMLKSYTTANNPSAPLFYYGMIFDTTKGAIRVSNGTNWVSPLGAHITGWGAPTGTATRTTFATTTVTTEQLAERVKALIDDLTTKGVIGT